MVFGLGAGKMSIVLEKQSFSFGDTIKGKAILELNNPINARGVKLKFWGDEEIIRPPRFVNGRRVSNNTKTRVNEITIELDSGEKEYVSKEYEFELKIPQYTSPVKQTNTSINLGPLSFGVTSGATSRVKWFLEASLDIPAGFDVRKIIQLNIV